LLKVVVDADACPRSCLQILQKHKQRWNYRLLTVASVDHQIDSADHIMVGRGSDSADWAVINNTARGDIVVTQDWGLAALVLGKGPMLYRPQAEFMSSRIWIFFWKNVFGKLSIGGLAGAQRGLRPGQLKMIRDLNGVFCACWS